MTFLDTSFVFALASARDEHHERVKAVFAEYRGTRLDEAWVTTNHVVAETVTLLRKLGHQQATEMGRYFGRSIRQLPRSKRGEIASSAVLTRPPRE